MTAGDLSGRDRDHGSRSHLVPILLALYLSPALLLVLLVGGLGMLVVAAARALRLVAREADDEPRTPIGPDSSPA